MTIYNITMQVSTAINDAWRKWLDEEYIPAILSTGFFTHYQLVRLVDLNEEGVTYAIQLYGNDVQSLQEFRNNHLATLQALEQNQWGEDMFSFGSMMEVIN